MKADDIIRLLLQESDLFYRTEYRFAAGRQWRFDFCLPDYRIAIEIEGGTWTDGRHTRGKGYQADCLKYNAAALDGWTVLRYPATYIATHARQVHDDIMRAVQGESGGASPPLVKSDKSKQKKIRKAD